MTHEIVLTEKEALDLLTNAVYEKHKREGTLPALGLPAGGAMCTANVVLVYRIGTRYDGSHDAHIAEVRISFTEAKS